MDFMKVDEGNGKWSTQHSVTLPAVSRLGGVAAHGSRFLHRIYHIDTCL